MSLSQTARIRTTESYFDVVSKYGLDIGFTGATRHQMGRARAELPTSTPTGRTGR